MIRRLSITLLLVTSVGATMGAVEPHSLKVVTEFANLVDRATGQPVPLYPFEGKILFIDFLADGCPVCQTAALQILIEIDRWDET